MSANNPPMPTSELGPIPPQSLEAETSLLGSMMLSQDAIGMVLPIITPSESHRFYRPDHRLLFEVLVDMYDQDKPMDLVVVRNELTQRNLLENVGGVSYLVQLVESVPNWQNIEHYARIVRDKGLLRDLISVAGEVSQLAYSQEDDANQILDQAEAVFFRATEQRISQHPDRLREILQDVYKQIETRDQHYRSGLEVGYTELDDLTSGFQPGEMIIVAGRPSMGKTTLGLNMAENVAVDYQKPVAFFSLEMAARQIALRVLCSRARVDSHRMRRCMLVEDELAQVGLISSQLEDAPLFIDDSPSMSVLELRAKVRRLKQREGIAAAFVDYLQLLHAGERTDSRQEEISLISRQIKALARELDIPIIAMAQLNRQAEGREGHRPRMSDLRESGALEQDADVVLLLHREEYYHPESETNKGTAELIMAKQRNGPTGVIKLTFNSRVTRFDTHSHMEAPVEAEEYGAPAPF